MKPRFSYAKAAPGVFDAKDAISSAFSQTGSLVQATIINDDQFRLQFLCRQPISHPFELARAQS